MPTRKRLHVQHVQLSAAAELAEVEAELEDAMDKGESTQTELQTIRDRIENLQGYQRRSNSSQQWPISQPRRSVRSRIRLRADDPQRKDRLPRR